ncbi:hypothetical protein AHAS_Ahas06G0048900 [Arachis hypogaea]
MNFLCVSADWDITRLKEQLSDEVVNKISSLAPPFPWKNAGYNAWTPLLDGSFSLKTAYQSIQLIKAPMIELSS